MDQLADDLGGRAAEELVFHEVTTGAANDIEKVTSTAKQMIMRYGMSEKLGPRVLGRNHDMPFLGREMGNEPDYSDEIAREIDDEIRRVIEEAHDAGADRCSASTWTSCTALGDPDRARDDRQGAVRAAARRRGRGGHLQGGAAEGRGAAGRGAEAHPRAGEAEAVPASRRDDAAPAARRRAELAHFDGRAGAPLLRRPRTAAVESAAYGRPRSGLTRSPA